MTKHSTPHTTPDYQTLLGDYEALLRALAHSENSFAEVEELLERKKDESVELRRALARMEARALRAEEAWATR